MSAGQGSISYQTPQTGGGGASPVTGARSGVSLDGAGNVILGVNDASGTDPEVLLWNTRILTDTFEVHFVWSALNPAFNFQLNSQSAGGGVNTIPTLWRLSESGFLSSWQPSNYGGSYSPGGTADRFYSGIANYPGVNEPTSARPNVVGMWWGYNVGYNQGIVRVGEPGFRWATETCFYIGPDPYFEFHIPEIITASGTAIRLDSTYVDNTTGIGFREYILQDFQWASDSAFLAAGQPFAHLQYNSISDTSLLGIESQFSGGISELALGNYVDGGGAMTYQSGQITIRTTSTIDLRAATVFMDATSYNGIVQPVVVSTNVANTPNSDTVLDASPNTNMGFRRPQMTTTERNALVITGGPGLLIWNTTTLQTEEWNGTAWVH